MNMGDAITTCFKKYASFAGRASRREYWYFFLFYFIVEIFTSRMGVLGLLVDLGIWIPLAAAAVRRLHDAGKSGWWVIFPLVNLVFLTYPAQTENNRYS
ncbi:MAG TPA: DUF805 domain-containing protein [Acidimicrobiales bacterium]|nr:DUF805 domain-containing protein [Acidimicrobiales bacterium]